LSRDTAHSGHVWLTNESRWFEALSLDTTRYVHRTMPFYKLRDTLGYKRRALAVSRFRRLDAAANTKHSGTRRVLYRYVDPARRGQHPCSTVGKHMRNISPVGTEWKPSAVWREYITQAGSRCYGATFIRNPTSGPRKLHSYTKESVNSL
jgi:hypothetical protein